MKGCIFATAALRVSMMCSINSKCQQWQAEKASSDNWEAQPGHLMLFGNLALSTLDSQWQTSHFMPLRIGESV